MAHWLITRQYMSIEDNVNVSYVSYVKVRTEYNLLALETAHGMCEWAECRNAQAGGGGGCPRGEMS